MLSISDPQIAVYNCTFQGYFEKATIDLRFPSLFFIEWKSINGKQNSMMNCRKKAINKVVDLEQSLTYTTEMIYHKEQQQFLKKQTLIHLNLISNSRPDQVKLVGRILIDLSEIANKGCYNSLDTHKLLYCSVNADLSFKVQMKKKIESCINLSELDRSSFSDIYSFTNNKNSINRKNLEVKAMTNIKSNGVQSHEKVQKEGKMIKKDITIEEVQAEKNHIQEVQKNFSNKVLTHFDKIKIEQDKIVPKQMKKDNQSNLKSEEKDRERIIIELEIKNDQLKLSSRDKPQEIKASQEQLEDHKKSVEEIILRQKTILEQQLESHKERIQKLQFQIKEAMKLIDLEHQQSSLKQNKLKITQDEITKTKQEHSKQINILKKNYQKQVQSLRKIIQQQQKETSRGGEQIFSQEIEKLRIELDLQKVQKEEIKSSRQSQINLLRQDHSKKTEQLFLELQKSQDENKSLLQKLSKMDIKYIQSPQNEVIKIQQKSAIKDQQQILKEQNIKLTNELFQSKQKLEIKEMQLMQWTQQNQTIKQQNETLRNKMNEIVFQHQKLKESIAEDKSEQLPQAVDSLIKQQNQLLKEELATEKQKYVQEYQNSLYLQEELNKVKKQIENLTAQIKMPVQKEEEFKSKKEKQFLPNQQLIRLNQQKLQIEIKGEQGIQKNKNQEAQIATDRINIPKKEQTQLNTQKSKQENVEKIKQNHIEKREQEENKIQSIQNYEIQNIPFKQYNVTEQQFNNISEIAHHNGDEEINNLKDQLQKHQEQIQNLKRIVIQKQKLNQQGSFELIHKKQSIEQMEHENKQLKIVNERLQIQVESLSLLEQQRKNEYLNNKNKKEQQSQMPIDSSEKIENKNLNYEAENLRQNQKDLENRIYELEEENKIKDELLVDAEKAIEQNFQLKEQLADIKDKFVEIGKFLTEKEEEVLELYEAKAELAKQLEQKVIIQQTQKQDPVIEQIQLAKSSTQENELKKYQTETSQLTSIIENLKQQIIELTNRNIEFKNQIEQVANIKLEKQSLEMKCSQLEEKCIQNQNMAFLYQNKSNEIQTICQVWERKYTEIQKNQELSQVQILAELQQKIIQNEDLKRQIWKQKNKKNTQAFQKIEEKLAEQVKEITEQVKEQVKEVTGQVKEVTEQVKEQVKEITEQVKEQVKEQAKEITKQVKEELFEENKERVQNTNTPFEKDFQNVPKDIQTRNLQVKVQLLQQDLENKQIIFTELRSKMVDLEKKLQKETQEKISIDKLKAQNQSLSEQLAHENQQRIILNTMLDQAQNKFKDLVEDVNLIKENTPLQKDEQNYRQNEALLEEIELFRKENEDIKLQKEELAAVAWQHQTCISDRSQWMQKLTSIEAALSQKDINSQQEKQKFILENKQLTQMIRSLQIKQETVQVENKQLTQMIRSLQIKQKTVEVENKTFQVQNPLLNKNEEISPKQNWVPSSQNQKDKQPVLSNQEVKLKKLEEQIGLLKLQVQQKNLLSSEYQQKQKIFEDHQFLVQSLAKQNRQLKEKNKPLENKVIQQALIEQNILKKSQEFEGRDQKLQILNCKLTNQIQLLSQQKDCFMRKISQLQKEIEQILTQKIIIQNIEEFKSKNNQLENQIKDLNSNVSQKDVEIQQLTQKMKELSQKNEQMQKNASELNQINENLKKKKQEIQIILSQEKAKVEDSNNILKESNEQANKKYLIIESQVKSRKEDNLKIKQQYQAEKNEMKFMIVNVQNDVLKKEKQIKNLEKIISELKTKEIIQVNQKQNLESRIQSISNTMEEYEKRSIQLERFLAESRMQKEFMDIKANQLSLMNKELQDEINNKNSKIDSANNSLKDEIEQKSKQIEQLNKKIASKEQNIQSLILKTSNQKIEVQKYQFKLSLLAEKEKSLKQIILLVQRQSKKIIDELVTKQESQIKYQQLLEQKQREINNLRVVSAQVQQETQNKDRVVSHYESKIEKLERQLESFSSTGANPPSKNVSIDYEKYEKLMISNDQLITKNKQFLETLSAKSNISVLNQQLKSQVKTLNTKVSSLQTSINNLKQQQQKRINDLNVKIQSSNQKSKEKEDQCKNLTTELRSQKTRKDLINNQLFSKQVQEKQQEIRKLSGQIMDLKKMLREQANNQKGEKISENIKNLQSQIRTLNNHIDKIKLSLKNKEAEVERLKKQNEQVKSSKISYEGVFNQRKKIVNELDQYKKKEQDHMISVLDLQTQIKNLKESLQKKQRRNSIVKRVQGDNTTEMEKVNQIANQLFSICNQFKEVIKNRKNEEESQIIFQTLLNKSNSMQEKFDILNCETGVIQQKARFISKELQKVKSHIIKIQGKPMKQKTELLALIKPCQNMASELVNASEILSQRGSQIGLN